MNMILRECVHCYTVYCFLREPVYLRVLQLRRTRVRVASGTVIRVSDTLYVIVL